MRRTDRIEILVELNKTLSTVGSTVTRLTANQLRDRSHTNPSFLTWRQDVRAKFLTISGIVSLLPANSGSELESSLVSQMLTRTRLVRYLISIC